MADKTTAEHTMIVRQPATRWQDALPCGNGTIGALVFGHIKDELIILNHEDLFLRSRKPTLPDVSRHVPELRRMLEEGRYDEATGFFEAKLREEGCEIGRPDPYHPAFDLGIATETRGAFTNYRRSVDFETAVASVTWDEEGTAYRRDLFVSRADNVVVMRIRGSKPGAVSLSAGLAPHGNVAAAESGEVRSSEAPITFACSASTARAGKTWLTIRARYDNGGEYGGLARMTVKGGKLQSSDGWARIVGADEALIVIKIFANKPGVAALSRLRREINALKLDYAALLKRHASLHREMFLRMRLQLGSHDVAQQSNEELLMAAYDGEMPAALAQRMFEYGRYLLICSSRPGGLPANLQGVWNGEYHPPWACDYHNDENIQMNYWQALPGNLPEVALPYFEYYESSVKDYRSAARALYGCRGILAPIAQTTHGVGYPGPWSNWTAGAAWLAQLFYDYWLFTADRDFLRERTVPFLKEVAVFYEDFLIEDADGKLMFSPSLSPENVPPIPNAGLATINATMDVAAAREVLAGLCEACETLGIEKAGVCRWKRMLEKLPAYEVNKDGAMREWIHPDLPDNYHHRHLSHIYPVFPGLEVTKENDPRLFEAMRVAVEKRLVIGLTSQTGWSLAHMANIYARLGDGDRALECLELMSRSCVGPNLFTYHNDWRSQGITLNGSGWAPFQIDANFGWSAAVLEMLVYSAPGVIKLLPALPKKWPAGKAEGMLCRGGIQVSIEWNMADRSLCAALRAGSAQNVTLKFPSAAGKVTTNLRAGAVGESPHGPEYRLVKLPARKKATFSVKLAAGH